MPAADLAPRSRLRPALPPAVGAGAATYWAVRTQAVWAYALVAFAATLLLLALFAPRAFAPVQRVLDAFTEAILRVITYTLLGLVFALVFVPGNLLLRLRRRDPLRRAPDPAANSYWETARAPDGGDFGRQY